MEKDLHPTTGIRCFTFWGVDWSHERGALAFPTALARGPMRRPFVRRSANNVKTLCEDAVNET